MVRQVPLPAAAVLRHVGSQCLPVPPSNPSTRPDGFGLIFMVLVIGSNPFSDVPFDQRAISVEGRNCLPGCSRRRQFCRSSLCRSCLLLKGDHNHSCPIRPDCFPVHSSSIFRGLSSERSSRLPRWHRYHPRCKDLYSP